MSEIEKSALRAIMPAFNEKIAICLVLNEPFALFASVTLQSILDFSTQENNYDIFICTDKEFSENTKLMLEGQIQKKSNVSLRFINLPDYFAIQDSKNQNVTYPAIVFGRLFLPNILSSFEKIIYLDSDIIVNTDISSFYKIELGNKCIAAVNDLVMLAWLKDENHWAYKEIKNKVKIQDTKNYINSGFIIFNVEKYNNFITPERIITFEKQHYLKWPDQDLINIMFNGEILYLDQESNVLVALRDDISSVEKTNDENLIRAYKNSFIEPKIIHFLACSFLALKYPVRFFDKYWNIARRTPFYETLLQKAMENTTNIDFYNYLKTISIKQILKIFARKFFR